MSTFGICHDLIETLEDFRRLNFDDNASLSLFEICGPVVVVVDILFSLGFSMARVFFDNTDSCESKMDLSMANGSFAAKRLVCDDDDAGETFTFHS